MSRTRVTSVSIPMIRLDEPDGGRAWAVALCACIIHSILSGMGRMVGLLYVACIQHFGATRKEAALPFALRSTIRYMAGPLTGILGQRFGVRVVTVWGGLIAAAGSALCTFAPDIRWIVVSWGVVHGVGYAMANTLFQVLINQHFERHRASASGLVLSGACLSSLVLPWAVEGALDEFGLGGCFLLLAGLFLNVLPPAILLKSPQWIQFPEAYRKAKGIHLRPSQQVVCTFYREVGEEPKHPLSLIERPRMPEAVDSSLVHRIPLLYLNPVYVLISLSLATYYFTFLPAVTVIVDFVRDNGVPAHRHKFLIHALTIGDLLGRVGFGWVTDRDLLSLPTFMVVSFVCQGLFTASIPFAASLTGWIVCVGLYGVTAGIIIVHFPILVYKYVDEKDQTIAIGCIGLLYSILGFGIPPLIGHFRDHIGSYNGLFYSTAVGSIVNGFLWLLVPIKEKCTEKFSYKFDNS